MTHDTIVNERQVESPQISFIEIESTIKSKLTYIERKKLELQTKKDNLDAYYANDDEFAKLEEDRKVLLKKRKTARARLMQNKEIYKVSDEVKEARRELNSAKLSVSDLLLDFEAQSGQTVITDDDGELLPIVKTAKIAGRT